MPPRADATVNCPQASHATEDQHSLRIQHAGSWPVLAWKTVVVQVVQQRGLSLCRCSLRWSRVSEGRCEAALRNR